MTDNDMNSFMRFTAPLNATGSPTVTMPCGYTADGRPVGFQLVGPHCSEDFSSAPATLPAGDGLARAAPGAAPGGGSCGVTAALDQGAAEPAAPFLHFELGGRLLVGRNGPLGVAVGTLITERPPHRTVRAAFPHTAPPWVSDGKALVGPGMKDARSGEPGIGKRPHFFPVDGPSWLASAENPLPASGELIPERCERPCVGRHAW